MDMIHSNYRSHKRKHSRRRHSTDTPLSLFTPLFIKSLVVVGCGSDFADTIDQFAISYDNVDRYSMINGTVQTPLRSMGQEIEQLHWKTI